MPRRGKAKSPLAPIKEIMQTLQLDEKERPRFKALILHFLTKTKKLQEDDIIGTSDKAFYKLAREFLETETTPGKGPTHSQYWPVDDEFTKTLIYAADPTKIIKLVSCIMLNQRRNLLKARSKRRRQQFTNADQHQSDTEPGPSGIEGASSPTEIESDDGEVAASREASREPSEFPSASEIIRTTREAPAALRPSDPADRPGRLETPPITPAPLKNLQQRRTPSHDSPHPSIEAAGAWAAASEIITPQPSVQPAQDRGDRGRERSSTPFAEYNPRLPTHRDGTLDEASIKSWTDGVQYVQQRLQKFSHELREQHWQHPKATVEDQEAAQTILYKSRGLDEFVRFLGKDLQKQQKRLKEFKALRTPLGASEERGISRTLSP